MAPYKKTQFKDAAFRRYLYVVFVTGLGVFLLLFLLKSNSTSDVVTTSQSHDAVDDVVFSKGEKLNLPKQNELSISLAQRNQLPARNLDLYPNLPKDHITIVLYVHNRPRYLKVVIQCLSQVVGIGETLLVVSHDGYFEEMNSIIDGIKFCQVKQIFFPYSPHLFPNSFPGVSPGDCKEKDDPTKMHCTGNPDQYGNHRSPKIVSLKHHWWWMMNTVWDGLKETRQHQGHILFIEEDHFIFPNAYRNLQILVELKPLKCPHCYAANLAPSNVKSRGENWDMLAAERMGNIGYTFNRTVWRNIHKRANEFCLFDEYNWDITMWATVYPSFGSPVYSLRGPRSSAVHFGKCGLHQGQDERGACIDNGVVDIEVGEIDKVPNIKQEWSVHVYNHQAGYQAGFKGWGGWGDKRDHQLCLAFASMYLLDNNEKIQFQYHFKMHGLFGGHGFICLAGRERCIHR